MQHSSISITDMQAETLRLIDLQQEILQQVKKNRDLISSGNNPEKSASEKHSNFFTSDAIQSKLNVLEENRIKLQNLEMVLAVVGTMKAGKSTTINAIVGREILPNRNRPMTALPTRIRHTPGRTTPVLHFDKHGPIQDLVTKLFAKTAKQSPEQLQKLQDGDEYLADALKTLCGKQDFEKTHEGEVEIFHFLAYLNDLVRLSAALHVEFPFSEYTSIDDFPLIEVEFFHLTGLNQAGMGRFTILDTPGFNEEGQQDKLLPMMREQLEKATAVLAVLDYTQLKSESEGHLRKQLEAIATYANGRMFSLVNKFDAKDRNSSDEEQTRKYVAKNLLAAARINPESIFPVSSRNAYLAKRAELALTQQKEGIAWVEGQTESWVEDFAELAFGKRWKREINDSNAVQESAKLIWQESLFEAPLNKVVQFGYLSAAHQAIDASAHALMAHADELTLLIDGRLQMLSRTAPELAKAIAEVSRQIKTLSHIQNKAEKDLLARIEKVKTVVNTGVEVASKNVQAAILDFLKKGTVQTGVLIRKDLVEELSRKTFYKRANPKEKDQIISDLSELLPASLIDCQKILAGIRANKYKTLNQIKLFFSSPNPESKEKKALTVWPFLLDSSMTSDMKSDSSDTIIFEPEMVYESVEEAQKALGDVGHQVTEILQSAQTTVTQQLVIAKKDLTQSTQSLRDEVVKQIQQFGTQAEQLGLTALSFEVPDIPLLKIKKERRLITDELIEDTSRTVTRQRKQSSFWGGFKRKIDMFDSDWGYDDYEASIKQFVIKMQDMGTHWDTVVTTRLDELKNQVEEEFSLPVQESSDQFFKAMEAHFNQIDENLHGGLKNHEQSVTQQNEIRQSLQALKKLHYPTLQDLDCLVATTEEALARVRQDVTTGLLA